MRRFVKWTILVLMIGVVFCEGMLPGIAQRNLQHKVAALTQAESTEVTLETSPALLLLMGQADHVDIRAENALLGQVRVSELSLTGDNVGFDFGNLDAQDGSAVRRADRLNLQAVVSADNLKDLIQRKVDKIENIDVTISPEKITVTGQAKIMGRMADIRIEGTVLEENSSIYFRMSSLSIKNAIVGKAVLGNFFGDILLTNLHALPFKAELDDVVQKDGEVVITASRH